MIVHMLSGKVPNDELDEMDVMKWMLDAPKGRSPMYELPPKTNSNMVQFISSLLSPDSNARPTAATALDNPVFFPKTMKILEKLKIDPNRIFAHTIVDIINTETLLHHAAKFGYVEVLKELLQQTCNLNSRTTCQRTALDFAAENFHTECENLLVQAGADRSCLEKDSQKHLNDSEYPNSYDHPQRLITTESSIHAKVSLDETILNLRMEVGNGHLSLTNDLHVNGAEMNREDIHGYNARNVHAQSRYSKTPLDTGAWKKCCNCLQNLNDVDARNKYGFTALHVAALKGHMDCLKTLIEAGADRTTTTTESGKTALDIAIDGGKTDCIVYLTNQEYM